MNTAIKSIFVTLMFTLVFGASFCQDKHTIVLWLEPGTNILHDPGTDTVHRGDSVTWEIRTGEDIRKFRVIGPGNPFNSLPDGYTTRLRGAIRGKAKYVDWKYKIIYQINSTSKEYHLDPKISVQPRPKHFEFLVGFLAILLAVFFTARYLIQKKKLAKGTAEI